MSAETRLEMTERHVREFEAHVAKQHEIVAEMERDNHPDAAKLAQSILLTMKESLRMAREHF